MLKTGKAAATMAMGGVLHVAGLIAALPLLPAAPDFGAYYVAAWAIRVGHPIYPWQATVDLATEAGLSVASFATVFRYLPSTVFPVVPLTFLPYAAAALVWTGILVLGVLGTGVILARMYRQRRLWVLVLCLTYAPVGLGLGWGNIACLLPLAAVLLAGGGGTKARPSIVKLGGYTLIVATKLFPFLWLWPLCLHQRWRALLYVAISFVVLVGATFLSPPNARVPVFRSFVEEAGWIVDSSDVRIGQPNIYAATLQLTRPVQVRYERRGLEVDTTISPLVPLAPTTAIRTALALSLAGSLLAIYWTHRIVASAGAISGFWFLSAFLCVVLPVTNYPYLAVTLPALIATTSSRRRTVQWLGIAAYAVIGLGRFVGYLVALLPQFAAMSTFAALGPLLLCYALYLDARTVAGADGG